MSPSLLPRPPREPWRGAHHILSPPQRAIWNSCHPSHCTTATDHVPCASSSLPCNPARTRTRTAPHNQVATRPPCHLAKPRPDTQSKDSKLQHTDHEPRGQSNETRTADATAPPKYCFSSDEISSPIELPWCSANRPSPPKSIIRTTKQIGANRSYIPPQVRPHRSYRTGAGGRSEDNQNVRFCRNVCVGRHRLSVTL